MRPTTVDIAIIHRHLVFMKFRSIHFVDVLQSLYFFTCFYIFHLLRIACCHSKKEKGNFVHDMIDIAITLPLQMDITYAGGA